MTDDLQADGYYGEEEINNKDNKDIDLSFLNEADEDKEEKKDQTPRNKPTTQQ